MNKQKLSKETETKPDGYTVLGGVPPVLKCAVKVLSTGEHCPEEGKFKIDDSEDYLCERCYENWTQRH